MENEIEKERPKEKKHINQKFMNFFSSHFCLLFLTDRLADTNIYILDAHWSDESSQKEIRLLF